MHVLSVVTINTQWKKNGTEADEVIGHIVACHCDAPATRCQQDWTETSNASITGTNPSPNKRGLHCLSVSLTDRMDAA
jgi:hypothetical protein